MNLTSSVLTKHTWYFVTEIAPLINEWAAILAVPFTSELFIKSFSYFRQRFHHIKFTIASPVQGCTTVLTLKMLSLPQLLNASVAMELHFLSFGNFDAIMSTVLIKSFNVWERKQAEKNSFGQKKEKREKRKNRLK